MTRALYRPENWAVSPLASERPQLVGGRCAGCQKVFFPRFPVCPACLCTQLMTGVPLGRRGVLYSYSVIHTSAPGFKAPYAVAYVDLPEGPRVFGHLDGALEGRLELGREVEVYGGPIGSDAAGNEVVSVRFRAVDASRGDR